MDEADASHESKSRDLLRAYLAGHDVECPQCQYNLRDLLGDRCPECGLQIILRLQLAEPKVGTLIAGLVGLSAGAGFSGLMLFFMAIQTMIRGDGGVEFWNLLIVNTVSFMIEGLAVIAWIRNWRRLRSASGTTRALLVLGCWLLSLANIIVFSIFIR